MATMNFGADVLAPLRDLLSADPLAADALAEDLADHLRAEEYLPHWLSIFAVQAAINMLSVEGEVLP